MEDYLGDFPELEGPLSQLFDIHDAISLPTQFRATPAVRMVGDGPAADNANGRLPQITGYRVERVLGSGGMGVVYLAHDLALKRDVALKILRQGSQDDDAHRGRFQREAAAAAKCQHPNLVQIFHVGEHNGELYLALEYVEGDNLAKALAGTPMPPREAAALVEKLARAVDHAHCRGVVHRDLKPANVLMAKSGEPKITDFGLARLDDASIRTEFGAVFGTLAYMAPEQAGGGMVGAPADIHALGVVLYEALTGRPPYRADTPENTLQKTLLEEAVAPSARQSGIPRELESICLKCLQKRPNDRYATAADLAEDLRRFLDGRPVMARPVSPAGRLWRWCRRNPWVAALSAAVVATLVVGTTVSTFLTIRATRAEGTAESAARNARTERDRAEHARDLAFTAVETIILTDKPVMLTEEALPFRAMLLDEGLRLSREIIRGAEGDTRATKLRAEALMMEAKVLREKGDHTRAAEVGNQSVDLLAGLVARDPGERSNREALAHYLREQASKATDWETRRANARRSNELYMALLSEDPQSHEAAGWSSCVATNLHNIGNEYFLESQSAPGGNRLSLLREAIEAFSGGVRFCSERVEREGRRDRFLASLALNERYLCRAHAQQAKLLADPHARSGRLKEAISWGAKAVEDFHALADQDPSDFQRGWDVHEAERELGIAYFQLGSSDDAIQAYEKARETLLSLRQRHGKLVSRMVLIQENIAVDDFNLINVLTSSEAAAEKLVRELVDEAYAICEKLDVVRPLSRNLRNVYAYCSLTKANLTAGPTGLSDVNLNRKAARLYEELVRENPAELAPRGNLFLVRLQLADALAARGSDAESRKMENEALVLAHGHPDVLFGAAQLYAVESRRFDNGPSELDTAVRDKVRQRYARRVVPLLREAVASGFKNAALLRADPAFTPFQSDPGFRLIVYDLSFPIKPFAPP